MKLIWLLLIIRYMQAFVVITYQTFLLIFCETIGTLLCCGVPQLLTTWTISLQILLIYLQFVHRRFHFLVFLSSCQWCCFFIQLNWPLPIHCVMAFFPVSRPRAPHIFPVYSCPIHFILRYLFRIKSGTFLPPNWFPLLKNFAKCVFGVWW